jgi:hypothetical protein
MTDAASKASARAAERAAKPSAAIAQLASVDAADPMGRMPAYAASGASPQEVAAEAPKPASGKSHRRGDVSNGPQ